MGVSGSDKWWIFGQSAVIGPRVAGVRRLLTKQTDLRVHETQFHLHSNVTGDILKFCQINEPKGIKASFIILHFFEILDATEFWLNCVSICQDG